MNSDQDDEIFELVRTVIVEEGSICEHTNDDGPTIIVDVDGVTDAIVKRLHEKESFVMSAADWHEERFGTPSLATDQDAIRDARVVELEAALRTIAAGGDAGGSFSGTQCAEIAREALGAGEVERIPGGVRWQRDAVMFTRYPPPDGDWHLIGPAVLLEPGMVIEVERFTGKRKQDMALVAVGRIVAERTVIHKDVGPVQYVVARLSRAVKD